MHYMNERMFSNLLVMVVELKYLELTQPFLFEGKDKDACKLEVR